jgi:hypothetical protein
LVRRGSRCQGNWLGLIEKIPSTELEPPGSEIKNKVGGGERKEREKKEK